ncbi:hypothetical protein [Angustibacter aerolatus]
MPTRRPPSDPPEAERPWLGRRVYRFLFRFMGPAQLGSWHEPPTAPADGGYACPVCGAPMRDHDVVVTNGLRRLTCPRRPAA